MRTTQALLERVTAVEANRLAYKDMKTCYYVAATLTLYGMCILVAILVDDISKVFDFIGAIATSAISFVFPGWFYLSAVKQFGGGSSLHKCGAYCFIVFGFCNFCLGNFAAIMNIVTE